MPQLCRFGAVLLQIVLLKVQSSREKQTSSEIHSFISINIVETLKDVKKVEDRKQKVEGMRCSLFRSTWQQQHSYTTEGNKNP